MQIRDMDLLIDSGLLGFLAEFEWSESNKILNNV